MSQHFGITGNVAYRVNGSPLKAFKTFISGSIGMIQSQEVTRLQAISVDLNRFELLAYNWVWECKKKMQKHIYIHTYIHTYVHQVSFPLYS